jgi:hypothetical protein
VIVAAWIASPPHHRILLGGRFRDIGVGVATGTPKASTGATYTLDAGVQRPPDRPGAQHPFTSSLADLPAVKPSGLSIQGTHVTVPG